MKIETRLVSRSVQREIVGKRKTQNDPPIPSIKNSKAHLYGLSLRIFYDDDKQTKVAKLKIWINLWHYLKNIRDPQEKRVSKSALFPLMKTRQTAHCYRRI